MSNLFGILLLFKKSVTLKGTVRLKLSNINERRILYELPTFQLSVEIV